MKNSIEIQEIQPGIVQTIIATTDGVTCTEIHRKGLDDVEVLNKIKNVKMYRYMKGTWVLSIPREHRAFQNQDFDKVISATLVYMDERDNPSLADYFC